MAFTVKTNRKHTFKYTMEDESEFSVTFEFMYKEDRDSSKIIEVLAELDVDISVENKDEIAKNPKARSALGNMTLYLIRTSLIECSGIMLEDAEGKITEAAIKDKDGKINVETQKGIFDAIWDIDKLRDKIQTAWNGPTEKNSSTGATPQ